MKVVESRKGKGAQRHSVISVVADMGKPVVVSRMTTKKTEKQNEKEKNSDWLALQMAKLTAIQLQRSHYKY